MAKKLQNGGCCGIMVVEIVKNLIFFSRKTQKEIIPHRFTSNRNKYRAQ